jgi:simple sugar transport system ATP-binding protein
METHNEADVTIPHLSMRGVTKLYQVNNVLANDHADFEVSAGEIHALVGENGAGKTTLMKILNGMERPDEGEIHLGGRPVSIHSPKEAAKLGIGMVHQHFRLFADFTVAENVVLGQEPTRGGVFYHKRKADAAVARLIEENGFNLNPRWKLKRLTIGQLQQVEIIKVLYRNADLLVLDEPTTILTEGQINSLFDTLRSLIRRGKTIIFISHKLQEVIAIADRVSVMKRGSITTVRRSRGLTAEQLAHFVVGDEEIPTLHHRRQEGRSGTLVPATEAPAAPPSPTTPAVNPVFELRDVSYHAAGQEEPALSGITLSVGMGEIVGVTGLNGNGLSELEDVSSGMARVTGGSILHNGQEVSHLSIFDLRKRDLAYVPANRLYRGASLESTVYENLVVTPPREVSLPRVVPTEETRGFARKLLEKYSIKATLEMPIGVLSGGNIQRVILARELGFLKDFIIFSEPTWGIDVSGTRFIFREILRLRDEGMAVLLISTDLDEIKGLSDRIAVLFRGKLVGVFENTEELDRKTLGRHMLGVEPRGIR